MADGGLVGRVALITGGGGEIGGAIARRFALEGADVVVADLRADAAAAAADAINAAGGGRAASITADVSRTEDAERCVLTALARFGKLTTLVNVAATVTPDGTVETLTLEDWNQALAVNLTSVFLMCKYAVPAIRAAGGGTIVNIASQLGQIGVPQRAPYTTSKAAMIQFTRCLAIDHAADRIRVNSLSPGGVDTARTLRRFNGDRAAANRARAPAYLVGRVGRPEEIADGALFLASDQSSFMTGADLLMDGGYLAFKGGVSLGSSAK
jgi:NAD(P)-dependent dehydrogenase (short-subunit alcohol dehydrogenase family)